MGKLDNGLRKTKGGFFKKIRPNLTDIPAFPFHQNLKYFLLFRYLSY